MQEQGRGKPRSPWMPLLIAVLISPVTGVVVYWLSLYAIATLADSWQPVWLGDSSYSQIIVLTSDHSTGHAAELIPVYNAANYAAVRPGSSFLIPVDRKEEIQAQLKADLKLSSLTFDVKPLPDGQEEITLSFMDRTDDSYGSRYRASKDRVQLESYRYASDRGAIGVLLYAMILTVGIHMLVFGVLLVRAIYLWWRRRRAVDVLMART